MKSSSETSRPAVLLEVHEGAVVAAAGHKEPLICLVAVVALNEREQDEYHKEVSSEEDPHPPRREIPPLMLG